MVVATYACMFYVLHVTIYISMLPYSELISRGENFEAFVDFMLSLKFLTTKIFRHSTKGIIMEFIWYIGAFKA